MGQKTSFAFFQEKEQALLESIPKFSLDLVKICLEYAREITWIDEKNFMDPLNNVIACSDCGNVWCTYRRGMEIYDSKFKHVKTFTFHETRNIIVSIGSHNFVYFCDYHGIIRTYDCQGNETGLIFPSFPKKDHYPQATSLSIDPILNHLYMGYGNKEPDKREGMLMAGLLTKNQLNQSCKFLWSRQDIPCFSGYHLFVNSHSQIVVFDNDQPQLCILDSNGQTLHQILFSGPSKPIKPHGLAFDAQENYWITDFHTGMLTVLNKHHHVEFSMPLKRSLIPTSCAIDKKRKRLFVINVINQNSRMVVYQL